MKEKHLDFPRLSPSLTYTWITHPLNGRQFSQIYIHPRRGALTNGPVTLDRSEQRTSPDNSTENLQDIIRLNNEHIQDVYRTKGIFDST